MLLVSVICTSSKAPIEELYIAGCGNKFIARVCYETGEILWQKDVPLPEDCNDIELTKKGVLYAYKDGARLVKESGDVVWDYKVPTGSELNTATKVKKGYLLAVCGPSYSSVIMLNNKGEVTEEVQFDTEAKRVHTQLRQVILTDDDTFLLPVMSRGELIEVNREGEVIKRIKVGGNPFSVHTTNTKGEYMVSCGDGAKIVFVDLAAEKITREITNNDIQGDVKMLFVAELAMLKNGNIFISNWNGHSRDKNEAKIFEIDSQNRVVSTMGRNGAIVNISAFDLIK